jgi:hypothetical protein
MTLRRFLDAAFALMVEEYQRLGSPLIETLEQLGEYRARSSEAPSVEKVEQDIARRNEESLRQLQQLMGGVG